MCKNHVKVFIILLIAALVVVQIHSRASAQTTSFDPAVVDQYVQEVMSNFPIPGMAVAVVRGDQVLYTRGFGTANRAGDPVTPQTPFPLASVTKSFTALAIQQLAAKGKINLDSSLKTYLTDFQLADPQAASAITLRHLMEHTSGISQVEGTQPYLHDPDTTLPEAMAQLAEFMPSYQPGEQYDYSNWNYILLGEVVARVTGQAYTEYIQANVLNPLEMTNSSFADYHTIPGAASGNYISFGFSLPFNEKHVPVELSAGYLTASVEDMARYLIPYVNQGQYAGVRLLPEHDSGSFDANWNWKPGVPADVAYVYSGGHNSINTGFQIFPLQKLGVVVLMNTRLDLFAPGPTATDLAFHIAQITLHSPYQVPSRLPFYGGYALIDGLLILLFASILWQGLRLKKWAVRLPRFAWVGIAINLVIVAVILAVPALIGSSWPFMLRFRSDVTTAYLAAVVILAAVSAIKAAVLTRRKIRKPALQPN